MWPSTSAPNRTRIIAAVISLVLGVCGLTAAEPDSLPAADSAAVAVPAAAPASKPDRRRISPVENAATTTTALNELEGDTAIINRARRARSVHYHDDQGRVVYVDTISGEEWVDSLSLPRVAKMQYALLHSASVGVNIWDPVMRLFGQKYGLISFSVHANLHNRYIPSLEVGLGQAKNTPSGMNFTYSSPMSVYFKLGADYNFLYNSNPDYQFYAGLRYGFSPFSYSIKDISISDGYWDTTTHPVIPSQHATVGWVEFRLGLKVKLAGPVSAGWSFIYHGVLHQSHPRYGDPWYIPGYGTRNGSITGAFTIYYTLPLNSKKINRVKTVEDPPAARTPHATEPATPGVEVPHTENETQS